MAKRKIMVIAGSILLSLMLLIATIYTFLYFDNKGYHDKFYPGVLVNDIDISKLTQKEAQDKISKALLGDYSTFKLNCYEKYWVVNKRDIVTYDIDTIVQKIQAEQGINNLFRAFKIRFNQKREPKNYTIPFTFNDELINLLLDIKAETEIEPANAQFNITSQNRVEITPHLTGRRVDIEGTLYEIQRSLKNNLKSSSIIYKNEEPDIFTYDLEKLKVNDLLFSVESHYFGTGENRIYNIKLAASKIRNHLILPGEEFSFNSVVGPASRSNGYKEATIIRNGKFVPGYGGGVCQVSSNLYLGALKANLEILERMNHSRPVSYLPRGLDATIGYPSVDLRFRNNTPYGIVINTRTSNSTLTIDFFSYKPYFPSSVRFEHTEQVIPYQIEYIENPSLKKGEQNVVQRGAVGYRVITHRIITINGNTTRKTISTDIYRPHNKIMEVGTMPVNSDGNSEDNG